jgi:hypothetical protein
MHFETAGVLSLARFFESTNKIEMIRRRFRFVGTLSCFDSISRRAYLEHQGYSIFIDLSLVSMELLKQGSVIQVIGEIHECPITTGCRKDDEVFLKAQIVRDVSGLEVNLFFAAASLQAEHLKSF